jgi:hypothetical protein
MFDLAGHQRLDRLRRAPLAHAPHACPYDLSDGRSALIYGFGNVLPRGQAKPFCAATPDVENDLVGAPRCFRF